MTKTKKVSEDGIQIQSLYGGKVEVKFYGPTEDKPNRHMYYVDGVRKTGVTTYISKLDKSMALGKWQQGVTAGFLLDLLAKGVKIDEEKAVEAVIQHEIQRDEAADIGKEIHAWCEHFIRHELGQKGYEKLPAIPDFKEAVSGVNAFMAWKDKHKVKFISTERFVYSKTHNYVGTMDLEAKIDGLHCAGDFKSSNDLYNSVRMQLAAYVFADEEERGSKSIYEGRWAIRLSKYTEAEYIKRETCKIEIKQAIARFKGQEVKDYEIKPYKVFDAQFLDNDRRMGKKDMDAFLNCKGLYEWDAETNGFNRGGTLE